MSKGITEPPDIERIFDAPGREWRPEERIRVCAWLFEDRQLRYLLVFASRHLGHGATAEDAENAWGEFCLKRLDSVINSYDPAKGLRFWEYLLFCFKQFCWDEGEKIRKRRQREEPLIERVETEEGEFTELQIVDGDPKSNPEEAVLQKEEQLVVRKCVNELPLPYRQVVMMRYFEEMTVRDIAGVLGISVSNVKVRLFRARLQLAECLQKEGLAP